MDDRRNGWSDGLRREPGYGGARRQASPDGGYGGPRARAGAYGGGPSYGEPSYGEPGLPPELNPRGRDFGSPGRAPDGAPGYAPAPMPGGPGGGPGDPAGPGGPGGPGGGPTYGSGRRRRIKVRHVLVTLVVLIVAVLAGTYFWADSKLNRQDVLASYSGEPAAGKGTNWLIVGSDARQGLTDAQMKALHTGYDTGSRTDSMMLLHIGSNGNTLMSIPRDSYVTIPAWTDDKGVSHSQSKNKINAAFAEGGGKLMVQTVEYNTGVHIDHYAEIGFNGFVSVTDALGGVPMCLPHAIVDKASGANLKAGCQTLNGAQALAFVRERHQEATQDLARMQHQQQFLAALGKKAASPGTLMNPFRLYPTLNAGLGMLTVDNGTHLWDLGRMFFAMKGLNSGSGKSITVPIANANYPTPAGDAVKWNMSEATQVFDAFKNDTAVPSFSNG